LTRAGKKKKEIYAAKGGGAGNRLAGENKKKKGNPLVLGGNEDAKRKAPGGDCAGPGPSVEGPKELGASAKGGLKLKKFGSLRSF